MDVSTEQSEDRVDAHMERPPSYNANAEQLALPKLNLRDSHSSDLRPVSRDRCVAHLKLLAVLADLRDYISNSDGLFGLFDSEADKFRGSLSEAKARIREKRWAVYTARAVERYAKWWFTCLPVSRPQVTMKDLESPNYEDIVDCQTRVVWGRNNMPPLDILMVWHSHMLNPRAFLEDCIRHGKMSSWVVGMPWEVLNNCINDRTLEYTVSAECQQLFESQLQFKWDNLHDPPGKEVECTKCKKPNYVRWTQGGIGHSIKAAFKYNTGYADHSFITECKWCRQTIDHDRLKVAKFRQDLDDLLSQRRPMPGSIYNINGIPEGQTKRNRNLSWQFMTFPCRFMQAVGQDLLAFTDGRVDRCQSIGDLRSQLETKLCDRTAIRKANGHLFSAIVRPAEKVHFRRMMAHYWENYGPFALDLVGAVIRQGTFVKKMEDIDWLHSPTVMQTAERLVTRYRFFLLIMHQNPRRMAVPTLDIDLAWHTHQLSPRDYYKYTTKERLNGSRTFIDHDDKVDEGKLSEGFEWTAKAYRRITDGGIYSECTCWYCEATREPDLYDRILNIGSGRSAQRNAESLHDRQGISSDPEKNPHISAHNAVRPQNQHIRLGDTQRTRLRRNYEKAVRRAEKRGRTRSDARATKDGGYEPMYYAPLVWGYPIFVPYYGPYMCDPGISSNAYANNPGCMNLGAGAQGNCVSGTCGGNVAAGGCGGAGSVACAAGSGAACGGAAGGGGGGGCGGGGGGGGC